MAAASASIEAKLNKSLEDLIKEQSASRGGSGRGGAAGGRAGRGGQGRGQQQRTGRGSVRRARHNDDAMDTDETDSKARRRVDTSVLKAQGGVAKAGGGRQRRSDDAPKRGNLDDKWDHRGFQQEEGGARARPRTVDRVTTRPAQQAPANMTIVRIANLPRTVQRHDMEELIGIVDTPLDLNMSYTDDDHLMCEAQMRSEDAAREVQRKYTDCALDGRPLKISLAGTRASQMLKSGRVLEKVTGSENGRRFAKAFAQPASGGVPRGRGAQSGMRGF